jgi:hypothetical protein
MAERMTAAQAERDQARQEAGKARGSRPAGRSAPGAPGAGRRVAGRINPDESKPASTRKKGGE